MDDYQPERINDFGSTGDDFGSLAFLKACFSAVFACGKKPEGFRLPTDIVEHCGFCRGDHPLYECPKQAKCNQNKASGGSQLPLFCILVW